MTASPPRSARGKRITTSPMRRYFVIAQAEDWQTGEGLANWGHSALRILIVPKASKLKRFPFFLRAGCFLS
jgi:hypothetical protein